jgi:hypothetical protein
MVPGMTERERLATDVRRLEWLADATLGPVGSGYALAPTAQRREPHPALPLGLWRRGLSSARVLGQRVRLLQPGMAEGLLKPTAAPNR